MTETKSVRFGEFEVDLDAWVVTRNHTRIPLQKKPFQILRLLLSRPGELVSRAELAHELWPDLHVSYDHCLNTAVNALRNALNDPTRESRLIETHPGLGYRFAASVTASGAREERTSDSPATEPDLALGYYFLHRFSFDNLTRARACFHSVLKGGETDARAHAALSELESLTAVCGYAPTREASLRALQHAHSAQRSDPTLTEAHIAVAVASGLSNGLHNRAIRACSDALERSTPCVSMRIWLAEFLCFCGRADEAVEHLESAKRLNPISLLIRSKLALALYLSNRYKEAVEQAWSALSMEPMCAAAQYALALAYQQLGQLEDAVTEFENAVNCSISSPAAIAGLCHALHKAGRKQEAAGLAAQLREMARAGYVSRCWHALVHFACGERVAAERSLYLAAEAGDWLVGFARCDPRFQ